MEDGSVMREKRSNEGGFTFIEDDDDCKNGAGKEVQEVEITFTKEASSNGLQKASSEAADRIALSNRQLKARLRRQNLGYVLDLNPDLQMANVSSGVYLGKFTEGQHLDFALDFSTLHYLDSNLHILKFSSHFILYEKRK